MPESRSSIEMLLAEAEAEAEASEGAERPSKGSKSRRRKKKGKGLRNTLIVIGSLLALIAIGAGIAYALVASTYNEISRVSIEQDPSLERPAATETAPGQNAPINILLLGSDSRDTNSPTTKVEDLKGFRSDAILVAQISPDRQNVTVMSIMRDNWVDIQGVGEAKINAAIANGGLPLAVNTIENFIGARIDHVALIDFESFKGLTNAVGGVTVHNDVPFTAQNGGGGFTFAQGDITLDGDQALSFVRERYAFTDGDYQRARNQQAYLKGLMGTLLSTETLTDARKITGTFQALSPYLTLDEALDLTKAIQLGFDLRGIRSDDIVFFTSPTLGVGTSADGQSIVLPDWEQLKNVQQAFQDGTLHEFAANREPGSEAP